MKASRRRRRKLVLLGRENELAKKRKLKLCGVPSPIAKHSTFWRGTRQKGGGEALTHQRREISGCGAGGGKS